MSQIKDKEQAKERGEWNTMTPEQRQEADMGLRQLSNIARYHNVMGNHTIHMIELMTREIKTIFCHNSMVDRISGMLNYFLVHLVIVLFILRFFVIVLSIFRFLVFLD